MTHESKLYLIFCVITLYISTTLGDGGGVNRTCPLGCNCSETVVNCFSLIEFPTDLPRDTTLFIVSHLNVFEIPANAFAYLSNIIEVVFDNCNITNVAAYAFHNMSSVNTIIFYMTAIGNIGSYSFNGLTNMDLVYFYKCRIGRINSFAFFKLNSLKALLMYETHIRGLYTHSFYDCHAIGDLSIRWSNISDFVTGAFINVTDVGTVTIQETAFWNMRCDVLSGLEALSENFTFINNTFYCNCSVSWLIGDTSPKLATYRGVSSCHGPDKMVNTSLSNVVFTDLQCKGRSQSTSTKCEQFKLKPRPIITFRNNGASNDDSGDGVGAGSGNSANVVYGFSLVHVTLTAFVALVLNPTGNVLF